MYIKMAKRKVQVSNVCENRNPGCCQRGYKGNQRIYLQKDKDLKSKWDLEENLFGPGKDSVFSLE